LLLGFLGEVVPQRTQETQHCIVRQFSPGTDVEKLLNTEKSGFCLLSKRETSKMGRILVSSGGTSIDKETQLWMVRLGRVLPWWSAIMAKGAPILAPHALTRE